MTATLSGIVTFTEVQPFPAPVLCVVVVTRAKAPAAVAARGKLVCTCLNVTDAAIDTHLASAQGNDVDRLASLQAALKCGTNCGSCVPELKRMVRSARGVAPRAVIPIRQIA